MKKAELINDMKRQQNGSGFITRSELAKYMGVSCPKGIDKYIYGLEKINGKYYFIPEVVDKILAYKN